MPAGPVFGSLQQRVNVLGRWHDTVRSALA
jgi:hypothetical protein